MDKSSFSDNSQMEKIEHAWALTQFNDVDELKNIVPSEVDPNAMTYSEDNQVHSLLMCAAFHGAVECAKYLIKSGANVNQKNFMGYSALHWAAYSGRTETIRLLVDNQAKLEIKTQDGKTPLHIAASRGHIQFIKVILELGADLEAVNSLGWNALHFAVVANQRQVAPFLINAGISYKLMDLNMKTLEQIAEKYERPWFKDILSSKEITRKGTRSD